MTVAEMALAACGEVNMALKTLAVFEEHSEFASEMVIAGSEVNCVEENEVTQKGILNRWNRFIA